jgi:tetratricopeptide (TPR) repeat protein
VIPEVLVPLIGDSTKTVVIFYGSIAGFVLLVLFILWLIFGRGPRRRRAFKHARRLLDKGHWDEALAEIKKLRVYGTPSAAWTKKFDLLEGHALKRAATKALDDKQFEASLEHALRSAQLLGESTLEPRIAMQAAMVQEIRRLFGKQGETRATVDLIGRTLLVQSPCREASFWQAMCDLRNGRTDQAMVNLHVSRTGQAQSISLLEEAPTATPPSSFIDPGLYLGTLLLRKGQALESLRYLTEANRMDANCPLVTLLLGSAMIETSGDTQFAVRALQKALGPRGLAQWVATPQKFWIEGFPENRSYIRKLASEWSFSCPVWGSDLILIQRQGNLALAKGHFKLGNFKEAAELFEKAFRDGAPSLVVLRGLGLSLAKLGRYDEAFIHLRTAHEMEEPKDRITAGYLALCGARGKASRPEDRAQNIAWGIRTLAQFNAPGDAEWIDLINHVYAEARSAGVPLSADDQLYLCEHLVSIQATDATSAQAFHHLMATFPRMMNREYAWLFCHADQLHHVGGDHALAIYAMIFADEPATKAHFESRSWSFDDVEFRHLELASERAPGRFPESLGTDYAVRGEWLLLDRANRLEKAGDQEAALHSIEILALLAPGHTRALDRAAALHFRAGRLDRSLDLLERWHLAKPDDPLPLVRQALLAHQHGQPERTQAKFADALARTQGHRRASIGFLAARLSLQAAFRNGQLPGDEVLSAMQHHLDDCLHHDPSHPSALWCLAAVRWLRGDQPGVASLAPAMNQSEVADPRFHCLAALAALLNHDPAGAATAAERGRQRAHTEPPSLFARNGDVHGKPSLAAEAGYLQALGLLACDQPAAAIEAVQPLTRMPGSPTWSQAQALLGNIHFAQRNPDAAAQCWQTLDLKKRQAWNLVEPLAQTMFATAVESLLDSKFERAADQFRQAGKLGCRDRRLGPLLLLALFKAGQLAVYHDETAKVNASETNA